MSTQGQHAYGSVSLLDRDIGTWSTIIDITAIMSIIFNCALIAFTSNALFYYFPAMNEHEYDCCLDISPDRCLDLHNCMLDLAAYSCPGISCVQIEQTRGSIQELIAILSP